jgi:mycothiol synthase
MRLNEQAMLRVEPLHPARCSDPDWDRCYALHCTAHREQGTEARSLDAYRASHAATLGTQRSHWVAREAQDIVGKADLASTDATPMLAVVSMFVSAQTRQRGVARALLREALVAVRACGATTLQAGAFRVHGWRVCERFGGRLQQSGAQRSLALADAPWNTLRAFCELGAARSPQTRLEEFERLPDALAPDFVALYQRASLDAPQSQLYPVEPLTLAVRREQECRYQLLGWRWITSIAREPDGIVSGFTEIFYDPRYPELVRQHLTGVLPAYRGRGLAKWLKAAMLQSIRERFPAALRVTTNNADENAPMLAINRALGFGAALHHQTYHFDVADLCRELEHRTH